MEQRRRRGKKLYLVANFKHAISAMQAHALAAANVHPVGLTDQFQHLVGDDIDRIGLRRDLHRAGCGDQFHASLVDEQAQRRADAGEQAAAGRQRQVAPGRQRRVLGAGDVRRLRGRRFDTGRTGQHQMRLR